MSGAYRLEEEELVSLKLSVNRKGYDKPYYSRRVAEQYGALSYAQKFEKKKSRRSPPDEIIYPGQDGRNSLTLCLMASTTYIYEASKRVRFVFQSHAQCVEIKCAW